MHLLKDKIVLKTHNYIHLIAKHTIIYCKSDNAYTTFHLVNNESITVSVSLKTVEKQLNSNNFIRPHRSFLVNMDHVKCIDKMADGELLLSDKTRIPSSSRKRKVVLHFLINYTHIQADSSLIQTQAKKAD